MSHVGPAGKSFEIVLSDTKGVFGGSRTTKKYPHFLVNHFTRYAHILTPTQNSECKWLHKLIIRVTGTSNIENLLIDQYPGQPKIIEDKHY